MEKLYITGGKPLSGVISAGGMKNAADPIFFATLLVGDVCTIENVPDAADIRHASEILTGILLFFILGCEFFINYRLEFRKHEKESVKA